MKLIKDHLLTGAISGIILPTIVIVIFYQVNFAHIPFFKFLTESMSKQLLSPLLSVCAVVNLGLFYLYLKFNYLYSARGVIMATLIYGVAILTLKFAQ